AGIERHEAVRLGFRGVDDFPDVDVHLLAHQRKFVYQPDVDGAERILEQFRRFGDASRTDGMHLSHDLPVQYGSGGARVVAAAAYDTSDVLRLEALVSGVDALGRERK